MFILLESPSFNLSDLPEKKPEKTARKWSIEECDTLNRKSDYSGFCIYLPSGPGIDKES